MKYQYWLSNIPGVGCKTNHRLLGQAGSAEEIYFLKKEQLEKISGLSDRQVHAITDRKKNWDLEEKYAALGENGISFLSCEMESYPKQLRNIVDAPYSLYIKGKMPDFSKRRVAVVGARMCSEYGKKMAEQIGEKLALCGAEVLSGMARGIDAEGHKGALDTDTPTFAVLGSGVDVCYPNSNRWLYQRILEKGGGIISELPPGSPPVNWAFPARNRIISGLSDAVLVVEAKEQSGSLITANFALEHGHSVYALPGAVTEELSRGCNKLIFDGAGIAYSPEIMLMEWGIEAKNRPQNVEKKKLGLAPDLDLVYSGLDLRPENLDNLIRKTGFSASKVCALLTELQLMGLVGETGRQYYRISGG